MQVKEVRYRDRISRKLIPGIIPVALPVLLLLGMGCAGASGSRTHEAWESTYERNFEPDSRMDSAGGTPSSESTPDFSQAANLPDLITLAESRNPGLRANFDRWTAALERIPQATSLPDPKLSYAYFIEPVETRVGPQRQKFGLSQTIPLFGKLGLRGEIAVQDANAAGAQFEVARRNLQFRLTRLWNDYYYLNRSIAVTDENLRLLTYLESVALRRYGAGRTPQSAVLRAQVELGRTEDRLQSLRDQRIPLLAALNAELSRPAATPIAWPDAIDTRSISLSQDELRSTLLDQNPQLTALSFLAEKQVVATKLAGKNSLPDLTLRAELIDTDDARFDGVAGSGKNAFVAGATVNLPLWFGRNQAEKAEAAARLSSSENEVLGLRHRLLADFDRIHFEFRDANRKMELYAHTLLPRARQALEVAEDAFATGAIDFLGLIDAQRTLLEFQLAEERARVDRATKRAQLEQIVGINLESGDVTR